MKKKRKFSEKKYQKKFNKKVDNFLGIIGLPALFLMGILSYILDPGEFFINVFGFIILLASLVFLAVFLAGYLGSQNRD
tara:strand:+ start:133 stop:369 length:237 start_codon:yes stop_codon:yes gene_type:complete